MSTKALNTVNEVIVTGRAISINPIGDDIIGITVFSSSGRDIYPRFYCKKELVPELAPHARVYIKGHIHSYLRKTENGMPVMMQRFFGDEIRQDETLTEKKFGVKGKFFARAESYVHLLGKVRSIKKEGEWYRYALEVDTDRSDRSSTVARVSMRQVDRHPEIKKGDMVCCVCNISTTKKEYDDETKYYEDIIVSDIAVL